jgi:hypothetical protein
MPPRVRPRSVQILLEEYTVISSFSFVNTGLERGMRNAADDGGQIALLSYDMCCPEEEGITVFRDDHVDQSGFVEAS